MMTKALLTFACLLFLYVTAAAESVPISGTFFKGPIIGGTDRFVGHIFLQVRGERGLGNVTGGVLTGPAVYILNEEIINFTGQIGTLHAQVAITTNNGSSIVLGFSGFTSGATPTAQTVTVRGSWVVLSASGPDSGLQGEGQFTGVENFLTGETQGQFSHRMRRIGKRD
jgi:hypothetical protein